MNSKHNHNHNRNNNNNNNKNNDDKNSSSISIQNPTDKQPPSSPFHSIIVTSPDSRAARAAQSGPLQSLLEPNVRVLSTSDPFDVRMGSGGGTIAALDLADRSIGEEGGGGGAESVLIVHAGGESSRCPTQMALGKAWTSLPVRSIDGDKHGMVDDPTRRLVSILSSLLVDLPRGSVVVAASDVLLSLNRERNDGRELQCKLEFREEQHEGDVVGVAVPAALEVASNHGVFVVNHTDGERDHGGVTSGYGGVPVRPVDLFLQKPCVEQLNNTPGATLDGCESQKMAWIDTGIIIFLPIAANKLRLLAKGALNSCTEHGLQSLASNSGTNVHTNIASFAIPKIELYSHLLLALSAQSTSGWSLERKRNKYLSDDAAASSSDPDFTLLLSQIHDALASTTLSVATLERGQFIHLGTTRELLEFWVSGSPPPCGGTTLEESSELVQKQKQKQNQKRIAEFGKSIGLVRRACAFVGKGVAVPDSCVLINSIIGGHCHYSSVWNDCLENSDEGKDSGEGSVQCRIGSSTVLEHCHILLPPNHGNDKDDDGIHASNDCASSSSHRAVLSLDIGSNCLISGVRGIIPASFRIPSDMVLQMLPLRPLHHKEQQEEGQRLVMLCLGVGDTIKSCDTIYGVPFQILLEWAGLVSLDLWDVEPSKRTLWNARIHPVLSLDRSRRKERNVDDDDDDDDYKNDNLSMHNLDWKPLAWIAHFAEMYRSPSSSHQNHTIHNHDQKGNGNAFTNDELVVRASLAAWKDSPRLSLSQIRDSSDATTEFQARTNLTSRVRYERVEESVSQVLLGRCHESCDFSFVLEELKRSSRKNGRDDGGGGDGGSHVEDLPMPPTLYLRRTMQVLDSIIVKSMEKGNYDICGRSFMLLGGLLMDAADSVTIAVATGEDCESRDGLKWDNRMWKQAVGTLRNSTSGDDAKTSACERLFTARDSLLSSTNQRTFRPTYRFCGQQMECAAFALTELCISASSSSPRTATANENNDKDSTTTAMKPLQSQSLEAAPINQWAIATAPARIDLSGGWSDTPPLSYEHGGAVACLAVTVDGRKPLSARCRATLGEVGVLLVAECREGSTGNLLSRSEVHLNVVEDLADFRDPNAPCALLKCALLCLGLVPIDLVDGGDGGVDGYDGNDLNVVAGEGMTKHPNSLQPFVERFCRRKGVGLELVSTSLLPQGSGMGSSSILGGCVLLAIGRCVGLDVSTMSKEGSRTFGNNDVDNNGDNCNANGLIRAVLLLEQFLSTGGGWQDQVGGLVGGFKLGLSEAQTLPLQLTIRRVPLPSSMRDALNQRLVLIFTGRPRLAKNLLQGVLRRWARRTPEIVRTVQDLVSSAHECASAVERGDVGRVGELLSMYWMQKKVMAGGDSGVEPEVVKRVLWKLLEDDVIVGGTLCGAGGGGFLVVLTQEGRTMEDAKESLGKSRDMVLQEGARAFTWHHCCVSEEGIGVKLLGADGERMTSSYFDLQWHL